MATKTIKIGELEVPKKGLKPADWFLLELIAKYGDETFVKMYKEILELKDKSDACQSYMESQEIDKEIQDNSNIAFLYWGNLVRSKVEDKQVYLDWARDLYENKLPVKFKTLRKAAFQMIVKQTTYLY